MAAPATITTTDNLSPLQKQEAGRLSVRLNARFQPGPELKEASIHFRPVTPGITDQLIYYPEDHRLVVYWAVTPENSLEGALSALAAELPKLKLSDDSLVRALSEMSGNGHPANARQVEAYWSSPYQGGPSWSVRMQILPEWYPQWQVVEIAAFLNQHARLKEGPSVLQSVLLTYQAFRQDAHPDNGLLHYQSEENRLVINVPLPLSELPRLVRPASAQRYTLSALLLSCLYLQLDPGIPGLAFGAWRDGLERVFREEGFWEEVGEG